MAYHTALYLFLFLPASLAAYQLFPSRHRWKALLLAGYVFFYLISGKLLIYLVGTSLFTHYTGVWLGWLKLRHESERLSVSPQERAGLLEIQRRRERCVLLFGISVLLLILGYLKYYNFFAVNLNAVLKAVGGGWQFPVKALLLPIGISFYTLQAIGYMADVYWEKIPAERHLGKLALFLGFFPQIMEGPISAYSQTTESLWSGQGLKSENLSRGCVRILWGLLKKMVVADRLHVLVKAVFGQYAEYSGAVVAVAAAAYTIQLYMEFSGCMDIVIGSGNLFGVILPENFRRPFASRSAAEFWRRWHITLGAWLKTYIFYPISVSRLVKRWNRFGKKHLGRYLTRLGVSALALFPVWLCNGLWHGPRWSYIFFGMYYLTVLLCGLALEPVRNKLLAILHIRADSWYWKSVQILKTCLIVVTGELFFRAVSLKAGIHMFLSIFQNFSPSVLWNGTLLKLGLDVGDLIAVAGGCLIVGAAGFLQERGQFSLERLQNCRLPARWALYYGLIFAIIIFGAYGPGYQQVDLIYAGF